MLSFPALVKTESLLSTLLNLQAKLKINIPPEGNSKVSLEFEAKIVTRITKIKPEFLKRPKS